MGQEKEATVLETPLDEVQAPPQELPAMASAIAEAPPSSLSFVETFPVPEAPIEETVPLSFSVPQTIEEEKAPRDRVTTRCGRRSQGGVPGAADD